MYLNHFLVKLGEGQMHICYGSLYQHEKRFRYLGSSSVASGFKCLQKKMSVSHETH